MQFLKNEKKLLIIHTAEELFLEKGYSEVSIRELTKVAGISKSNFYNYFKNKEDLLNTISKDFLVDLQVFMKQLSDDAFEYTFVETVEFMNILAEKICLILQEHRKAMLIIIGASNKKIRELRQNVSNILSFKIKKLYFPNSDDSFLIDVLIDNVIGAILRLVQNESDQYLLSQKIKMLMKYHLEGLRSISNL